MAVCGGVTTSVVCDNGSLYTFGRGGDGKLGLGDTRGRFSIAKLLVYSMFTAGILRAFENLNSRLRMVQSPRMVTVHFVLFDICVVHRWDPTRVKFPRESERQGHGHTYCGAEQEPATRPKCLAVSTGAYHSAVNRIHAHTHTHTHTLTNTYTNIYTLTHTYTL